MSVASTLILVLAFVYIMLWIANNSTHEPKPDESHSNGRKKRNMLRPFAIKSKYSKALRYMHIDKK